MVKTYSAKDVFVAVGARALTGFSEDSKVTVEYSEDFWTKQTGVDGETTRSKQNNFSGTITIRLMRSSDDNEYLSGLFIQDKLSSDGVVPITIKDNLGTTLHFTPSAWIMKPPADEVARDANEKEWAFDCAELEMFHGKSQNA